MEFEDIDEQMQWETRRVATAFGVQEWDTFQCDYGWWFCGIGHALCLVAWAIESPNGLWLGAEVGPTEVQWCDRDIWKSRYSSCQVGRNPEDPQDWVFEECRPQPLFNELMSRGLYRLGIEDKYLSSHLPELSAHDKMELRLSIPREFWPKTWLEEGL